jgi:hypothetical protein
LSLQTLFHFISLRLQAFVHNKPHAGISSDSPPIHSMSFFHFYHIHFPVFYHCFLYVFDVQIFYLFSWLENSG